MESPKTLLVNDMFVTVVGNADFMIAWRRPWGAISIVMASVGMCLSESSNNTLFNRLFVWYSEEEYFARSEFQLDWGSEVLIHFDDLIFGSFITYTLIILKRYWIQHNQFRNNSYSLIYRNTIYFGLKKNQLFKI